MIPVNLAAKFVGVNWQYHLYKLLAIGVMLAALSYFWWDKGRDDCQADYAQANASHVAAILEERLPVVQQAERDAARNEQELRTIKERLDETLDRPVAADCSIDDEQLRLYREAAQMTHLPE